MLIAISKKVWIFFKRIIALPGKIIRIIIIELRVVFFNGIRIHWCNIQNFGDMLNPYLIRKILGKKAVYVDKHYFKKHYILCGSIMKRANKNSIVWGAGIMNKDDYFLKPKKVFAVRGPLTRKRFLELGYDCPKVCGDLGILLPNFYKPNNIKKHKIGVIPHYTDYQRVCEMIDNKNILIINLRESVEKVISEINSCEKTLSSSLHGLIVSHVYKVPSLWLEFSDAIKGDGVKFEDYLLSVNIDFYNPVIVKDKEMMKEKSIEQMIKEKERLMIPEEKTIKNIQKNLMENLPFDK